MNRDAEGPDLENTAMIERITWRKITAPKEKEGKLSWYALPLLEMQEVVKAFNYGASPKAYQKPFTYRLGTGLPQEDMYDAVMRHLERIQAGEETATDSGCMHWAHIAADAIIAIAGILIRRK